MVTNMTITSKSYINMHVIPYNIRTVGGLGLKNPLDDGTHVALGALNTGHSYPILSSVV